MEYLGPLAALLILLHQTGALLKISTSSPQRAFAGSDVLLHCTFSGHGSTADSRFLVIMWFYQGKEIVRYHDKLEISHPRVLFDERAARSGNASIILSDVKIEDEGIYSCLVIYSVERVEVDIILDVLVPPKIQVSSKEVSEEKVKTLICSVNGFYPGDITITWLRDREVLQNSSLDKKQRNEDRTYRVTSMVNVTSDRELENVSCRVQHESLSEPLQEDFQLVYRVHTEETRRIPVIIGVCCAAALLVVAVGIGLFIWKRKSRKKGGFTLSDIDGPDKLIDGEVVTLSCTGNHCAEDTRVTWLEERAGRDPEIIQSHGGDPEEAERLLNTLYVMDTKHMGSQRWSSNLRFIFHVANHKGVTFICRFTSGKKTHKKRFHCNEVYAKPRLVEPVKMTLLEKSKIQISLCLERFYPRDIEITWCSERNQSKYLLSSTESVTEGNDLMFNVTSDCSVSGSFFHKPNNKVLVEWTHESLDGPESRSWSVRDLPWRPVMEDIIPKLEAGKEVVLSCKITGYFPDSLSVQWIKKEKGNESEIKLPAGDYKVPYSKSNEETDKTFTRVTRLIFTPHPEKDQGAEFICRVTHPTLEEPIEKRTRPLVFNGRPDVSDIKSSRSGRLYLEVNKFYPQDIAITWRLDEESGGDQHQYLNSSITDNGVNNDGTYNVTSTCDALGDKVDKSKTYYVRAFVKHVTLTRDVQRSQVIKNGKLII